MKRYIKDGIFYNGCAIKVNTDNGERMIFNPTEEILLENGYVEYVAPEPTAEEKFAKAKQDLIYSINEYDSSTAVNNFTINGQQMWLNHDQRQQLKTSVEAYQATGAENVTKWFNNKEYTFPVATWLAMLASLEVYAGDAKNVTDAHIAAVDNLNTIEEVQAFDYTAGYPQKLAF